MRMIVTTTLVCRTTEAWISSSSSSSLLSTRKMLTPSSSMKQLQQPSFVLSVSVTSSTMMTNEKDDATTYVNEISLERPLQVLIAGAGVGGLALANVLCQNPNMQVTVIEQTNEFKRFGGPIQLASNALQLLKEMDETLYNQIQTKFTVTGNKMNGIKDGIRTEWYSKFDLATPAETRNMPYTGVIERPDLQQIYLDALPVGTMQNGDGVIKRYQ
jgi:hypothetical protein